MHVVIIGGHGHMAMHLARRLCARGDRVSSVVRNPEHVDDVAATGAEAVVADVEALDESALAEVLAGHDAVVWSAGAGGGDPDRTYAVDRDAAIRSMRAAEQAGVRRYVMVSYFGAGPDHGVPPEHSFHPYAEAKAAADEHLRGSGLDWTIVAPSRLTHDAGTGRIEIGEGVQGTEVPREDVAHVLQVVLDDPATVGCVLAFNTGSQPVEDAIGAAARARLEP